jgi:hypothetical protein
LSNKYLRTHVEQAEYAHSDAGQTTGLFVDLLNTVQHTSHSLESTTFFVFLCFFAVAAGGAADETSTTAAAFFVFLCFLTATAGGATTAEEVADISVTQADDIAQADDIRTPSRTPHKFLYFYSEVSL